MNKSKCCKQCSAAKFNHSIPQCFLKDCPCHAPAKDSSEWEVDGFDEKLAQMISDVVWAASDGGYRLPVRQLLTYQDEPVREFEDIKSLISRVSQESKRQGIEEAFKVVKKSIDTMSFPDIDVNEQMKEFVLKNLPALITDKKL